MEKKNKTEITIETDRSYIIRARRSLTQIWCVTCRDHRQLVPPEDVVALSGMSSRTIYRAVEDGKAHFVETVQGRLLVCLKSLGVAEDNSIMPLADVHSPAGVPFLQLISQANEEQIRESLICSEQLQSTGAAMVADVRKSENTGGLPARKRDWVLTVDALERLLNFLDADRECAGQKYEATRRKLIKYFECRGCLSPEEMADETINRAARRISEGKEIWASEPAGYFYGIARNVLREYWGAPEREFAPISNLQFSRHPYADTLNLKDLEYESWVMEKQLESLEECLQEILPESREMIIKYYQGEKGDKVKNRKALARRLGIPPNALRIRVHRIREKLEKQVKDRLDRRLAARNGF